MQNFMKTILNAVQKWTKSEIKNSVADWNQNDVNANSYIKNRPFYTEDPTETTILEKRTIIIKADSGYAELDSDIFFKAGETYIVNFNGTKYECVAWVNNDSYCIGNGDIYGGEGMGGDEPFCFNSYEDGNIYINTASAGIYTFSISAIQQKIITIPKKYLPELVGKSVENTEYNIDGNIVVADIGAEIFNDYIKNIAIGTYSHAEGSGTLASGNDSHAEGCGAGASGWASHAEGYVTEASGSCSHAEGEGTKASNSRSHAEGCWTTASGNTSHAEGYHTEASGEYSHAEGYYTTASDKTSHAEGYKTTASGGYSHAEGRETTSSSDYSHAEGYKTTASGEYSHVEGYGAIASGYTSHAEGGQTTASGYYSHAEGFNTTASGHYSHTEGKYNVYDNKGVYAHIVGNGTNKDKCSNAHTLDWNGNAWFAGDVYVGSTSGTNKDEGSKKLATIDDINSVRDYIQIKDIENNYDYIITMKNGSLVSFCKCDHIEITQMPTKTEYTRGEPFDPSGLVITAVYQDGTTKIVDNYTYSEHVMSAEDFEIQYNEFGINYTINIPLTINEFNPTVELIDFNYTANSDGTYTLTGWKQTLNGEPSTEMIIPNNGLIIV